jgi:hypothetical protein
MIKTVLVGMVNVRDAGRESLRDVGLLLARPVLAPPVRPVTKRMIKTWLTIDRSVKFGRSGAGAAREKRVAGKDQVPSEIQVIRGESEERAGQSVSEQQAARGSRNDSAPFLNKEATSTPEEELESAIKTPRQEPASSSAEAEPFRQLLGVPEFSLDMARQAWDMGMRTPQDVLDAARADTLRDIHGIGEVRQGRILRKLEQEVEVTRSIEDGDSGS